MLLGEVKGSHLSWGDHGCRRHIAYLCCRLGKSKYQLQYILTRNLSLNVVAGSASECDFVSSSSLV
jgi:hypothetical protein